MKDTYAYCIYIYRMCMLIHHRVYTRICVGCNRGTCELKNTDIHIKIFPAKPANKPVLQILRWFLWTRPAAPTHPQDTAQPKVSWARIASDLLSQSPMTKRTGMDKPHFSWAWPTVDDIGHHPKNPCCWDHMMNRFWKYPWRWLWKHQYTAAVVL